MQITYPPSLEALPLHKARLEAVCLGAMREQRIIAMSIWGSFVTGTADRYSDLDLALIADDDDVSGVVRSAREIAEASGPIVAAFTGEHLGEPHMLTVLYEDLLHVDLTAVGLSSFAERQRLPHQTLWQRTELSSLVERAGRDRKEEEISPGDLEIMEQRMWTWVWYSQSKILRGELWEAYDSINWMRSLVLFPLVRTTKGVKGEQSRRIDELISERSEQFARTVPAPDSEHALKALRQTVTLYLDLIDPLLAEHGVEPATAARRAVGKALAEGLDWRARS